MVTARSLKHAQLDPGLQEQELQGGLSKLYIQNRKRSRCQWPLALCGYQDPITLGETSGQQETNPKEPLFTGELFPWALLGSSMGQCHTWRSSRATSPPCQCHQDSTALTSCSSSGTRRSLPFHPSTCLGQKQIPSHLKGVSISSPGRSPQLQHRSATSPCPGPSSSSSLSQAWLGMEMCSWDRNRAPEPAFGYQPWVWFEILPEENVTTSSGRALLPQTLEKVTSHQCPPVPVHTFQEKHKQQLPDTSASQSGPKFTIASDRILFIAVHPPKRSRRNHL